MSTGGPSQYTTVVGTGTPPTSPNFAAPRFSGNDPADFWDQVNGVTDTFDAQAAKRGAIANADLAANANVAKTKLAPLDIMDLDVDANAAIAESKLALAADAAPGTPSRRTLGSGAQQACAGNDPRLGAGVPVGTIASYSGNGDPIPGAWIVADGRLIDRTQYPAFFAVTGHAYNGGADPGNNKVKIPDKRGKHSVGAINMGTGPGLSDNAHAQIGRGQQGGEVTHLLANGEMPVHSHGGGTGWMDRNNPHAHGLNWSDPGHSHPIPEQVYVNNGGASFAYRASTVASGGWPMYIDGGTLPMYTEPTGISASIQNDDINHLHAIGNDGGSGTHNNLGPYECDCYIVRIS